ncbi:AraC family transcriptional regulator [Burkholderia vietnamiensis]|uniref:AraC family transcriptional regulator n=1 Tax=Burkholderia vietnamiensis TaxID=60552 RepID=A0AAW7T0J7_BURVI|nr:AraC family transcriptional regulator [Burkholderia vietnamiensis]MBH9645800.1 AraC family transcriptional regulator [Burkholderia vietnamiensis]MBR8008926.1 AraC family transcriptional regulator [Burkholderia vietnamiensis]MDN7551255.1 AraC family transcriptional regulator [Burkholderia vietnamiensis]MDN7795069.1 AraC family transcriptional regulator [Burkholderia vietnamiensis]MDN8044432.1 AraC family transcriptional regulator [Burkholderia vietnamiensis]
MMRPVVTVPIFAVHGLLDGARAKGLATESWLTNVLRRADIAESLLDLEQSRVTVEQYIALFSAVKDSLDDEMLGYSNGRPMRCGSFVLMARSTLGAKTLSAALQRVCESFSLLQDDVTLVPVSGGRLRGVALSMRDGPGEYAEFLHALLLRVFWRLLVWLHGGGLVPKSFDFAFDMPAHAESYDRIFSGTLRFGQAQSVVWFDATAFEQPMRHDTVALQTFLRATPGNLVGPYLNERACSTRVRTLLQQACPEWPDLTESAQRLHTSVSALQRHLATEGKSFKMIKDELRRDMAIVRLTGTEISLSAIADELGFADSTAFQRAFKSWTGSAPGTYRSNIRKA